MEYSLQLDFTAAKERTIKMKFDVNDNEKHAWLRADDAPGTFCQSGNFVTAKWDNKSQECSFHVPAGVTESFARSVYLKALDTGGTVKKNNTVEFVVSRDNGTSSTDDKKNASTETFVSDPITVVSSPSADLYIDNGGVRFDKNYPREGYHQISSVGTEDWSGSFTLKTWKLKTAGWSDLGASTDGSWAGPDRPLVIDVSDFPSFTTWKFAGQSVTPVNGKLTINDEKYSGSQSLKWTIPMKDKYRYEKTDVKDNTGKKISEKWDLVVDSSKMSSSDYDKLKSLSNYTENGKDYNGNGSIASFDVQIIPDNKVFASDYEDATLNIGQGSEPGANRPKNSTTEDKEHGSKAGYPYVNNDWSRGIIRRNDPVYNPPCEGASCFYIKKSLGRPYTPSETIYENGNKNFGEENGSNGNETILSDDYFDGNRNVAQDTYVKVHLQMGTTADAIDCTNYLGLGPCNFTVSDDWLPSQQVYAGDLKVTDKDGNIVDASKYTVQWTKNATPTSTGIAPDTEPIHSSYDLSNSANDSKTGMKWITGIPTENDYKSVSAIRVTLNNDLPLGGGSYYNVEFLMQEVKSPESGNS